MSMILMAALLCLGADAPSKTDAEVADCLARVKAIHGGTGPWAIVGYRMGERALKDLNVPRQSFSLLVVHRTPLEVQYSCMADGLQASTGASAGKLNLKVEEATAAQLKTTIQDRKSGRILTFTVKPEFAKSILNLPYDHMAEEGERVARLSDEAMFDVVETKGEGSPKKPS